MKARKSPILLAFTLVLCVAATSFAAQRSTKRAVKKSPAKTTVYTVGNGYTFYREEVTDKYPFSVSEYVPSLKMFKSKVGFRHTSGKTLYVTAMHRTSQDANWHMHHLRDHFKAGGLITNMYGLVKKVNDRFIIVELVHFTESF